MQILPRIPTLAVKSLSSSSERIGVVSSGPLWAELNASTLFVNRFCYMCNVTSAKMIAIAQLRKGPIDSSLAKEDLHH